MAATFGNISPEAVSGFLRMFRAGRERAVADSEDFQELIFSVERFGAYLHGKSGNGLADYAERIIGFVEDAGVAPRVKTADLSPRELLDLVRRARNDYMHQGARARHLVHHAVALALLLEDALMNRIDKVKHFMTVEVATVEGWEPLSRVRHLMLQNGFSYIPCRKPGPQ